MTEEIRAFSGSRDADGVRPLLRLAGRRSTGSRCRISSTSTSIRRSISCGRGGAVASLVSRGGFGRLGQRIGLVLRRRAAAAGLRFAVVVRRPRAAPGAGDPDRRHPHRHDTACSCRRAGCTRSPRASRGRSNEAGCEDPLPITRHAACCASAAGSINGVEVGGFHTAHGRRGRVQRRSPGRLPDAARRRRCATCRPARPLLAVVPAVGRRRAR